MDFTLCFSESFLKIYFIYFFIYLGWMAITTSGRSIFLVWTYLKGDHIIIL